MIRIITTICLLLVFISENIYAQQMMVSSDGPTITLGGYGFPEAKYVIDTAKIKVTYTYSFIQDTQKRQLWKDRFVLEIGNRISRYYSIYADQSDSIMYLFRLNQKSKKVNAGINNTAFLKPNETANHDSYWLNYDRDTLMVSNMIVNRPYAYREPIPIFEWLIQPDTLQLLGYSCQLASTRFRGRNYKVWFTYAIPISQGPWKLSGLPGLILKAQTEDGYFDFEAIGIEIPKAVHPIYAYYYRYRFITHKDMLNFYRMSYDDPAGLAILHGYLYATSGANGKTVDSGEFSWPYVPFLELE